MDRRFGIAMVLAAGVLISLLLIGCTEKKSEMPIGEIMANTQVAPAQNVEVASAPAPAQLVEQTAAPTAGAVTEAPSVYIAPTAEDIQTALKNTGYYTGAIDGKLGPKSKKAIESFQNDNGLKVDGKVGPRTWEKLKAHLSKPTASEVATSPIAD
ncbi:MAG: peptidoglycan-binding domain-containing protein [Candidatus Omnitrophota bacterium]